MSVENIVVDIEINNSIAPDIDQSIVATIDNNINVIKDDTDDLDVTINRKEYVITGDEIYIPKRYEDAPTWLQNMIDQVVEYSIGAKVSDMNQVVYSLNQMIEAMEVSKNTYEMSVISSNDIDTRINTAITTLNSNMNEADATILSVANTKTTPEEAEAIMINAVRAELESTEAGTIGAAVATLSTAIANEEEARSTSVETLYSTMEGEFEATARAFNTINTYVGLDEVGASTGTGLSGYLEGGTGIVGEADSKVVNNVYVDALGNAKSKFEYGSIVAVNGINYIAGFGLSNSAGTDIGSEFWINAAKFKFTNDNKTGSKAPFTIDATGDVPEITFNGLVTFNSVDSVYSTKVDANNDAFAQRLGYISYADMVTAAESGQTIINGGYLRGELIEANSINAGQIDAYAITGKQITGGTINGTDINGVRITGAIIKASYIDYTTNLALSNWQQFKFATSPQIPVVDTTINSWTYSGSTITCTVGNGLIESSYHIRKGNTVLIQNLSCTTNPPNGEYVITEVNYTDNTFKFSVVDIPTGTASVSASSKVTSTYDKNFARNSDETNSLVVDNLGYVRLPAQSGFKTTGTIKTFGGDFSGVNITYRETHNETFGIYPWDDYTINTLNRAIYPDVNTNYLSGEFKIVTECAIHSFSKGRDGSYNYYDFYIDFLGDNISGHAYINTNSSGTNSWRAFVVNGSSVGTEYSKTVKGITYTLSSEAYTIYYYSPYPGYDPVAIGNGWRFTMTADFTGNKTITSYNFDNLIKLTRSEALMYSSPDDPSNIPICVFKHNLSYPVLNVQ